MFWTVFIVVKCERMFGAKSVLITACIVPAPAAGSRAMRPLRPRAIIDYATRALCFALRTAE